MIAGEFQVWTVALAYRSLVHQMKLRTFVQVVRHFGFGWLAFRARYEIGRRIGYLRRRAPDVPWQLLSLDAFVSDPALASPEQFAARFRGTCGRFFFDPSDRPAHRERLRSFDGDPTWADRRLAELEQGRLRFFSGSRVDCGWPPRWHVNAVEALTAPADQHFSRIDEFGHGDVKVIWEPNRFSFAFDLARIYWRTGNDRCAELFWQALEDWQQQNPPNRGINWKCGQESALRAMAWCFGLWAFLDHPQTTPQRLARLAEMLGATARRIEANITYAVSQQNNHGMTEAAGLFTIGLLFPMFLESERWRTLGRTLLERQALDLIYADGGFSQHSANYHRVMLHAYIWAIRLGALNGDELSIEARERVGTAGRFVLGIMDRISGGVPRYGIDDGALILALNNCAYEDYRPVAQATAAAVGSALSLGEGPWNEDLVWLFGSAAPTPSVGAPPSTEDFSAPIAGCHVLRSSEGMAFCRCGVFRHRPADPDLLHVDLWWRGVNVALDPGTYSYNAKGIWAGVPFRRSDVHNTVTIDGLEQGDRAHRFMVLPWPRASLRVFKRLGAGDSAIIEMEQQSYLRLQPPAHHRRAVLLAGPETWLVLDRVWSGVPRLVRLHWLIRDADHRWDWDGGRLEVDVAGPYHVHVGVVGGRADRTLVRADPSSARGWVAPRYWALEPALSLEQTATGREILMYSVFSPTPVRVEASTERVELTGAGWRASVRLPTAIEGAVEWAGSEPELVGPSKGRDSR